MFLERSRIELLMLLMAVVSHGRDGSLGGLAVSLRMVCIWPSMAGVLVKPDRKLSVSQFVCAAGLLGAGGFDIASSLCHQARCRVLAQ